MFGHVGSVFKPSVTLLHTVTLLVELDVRFCTFVEETSYQ